MRGVHKVTVKGKTYYRYGRGKGSVRLPDDPESSEFLEALAKLKAAERPSNATPGTFADMVDTYKRSSAFKRLAPRTKSDYLKVLDYLDKPLGKRTPQEITPAALATLVDRIAEKRNWRFANYCLAVVSRVFAIGRLRGKAETNPALGVPKLERPKGQRDANRPWTDRELETVVVAAPKPIALAVALGAYTGLREGDVLRLPWSAYDGADITLTQGKNHEPLSLPVHDRVKAMLAETKQGSPVIVLGERGRPYTSDGFRTMFFRLVKRLEAERKVGQGLTFHGLRHTVATKLADAGADDRTIQAVLGWTSTAMAKRYTKKADQKKRAAAGLRLIK